MDEVSLYTLQVMKNNKVHSSSMADEGRGNGNVETTSAVDGDEKVLAPRKPWANTAWKASIAKVHT